MEPADRAWRCFVAVPVAAGLRAALADFAARLQRRPGADAWRWTGAEGWHVTLAFLGGTEPAAVPRLGEVLSGVADEAAPFVMTCGGVGTFPSRRRARVVWYGLNDSERRLRRLARRLREALGLEREQRFRAHLTLARVRERFGTDASSLLDGASPPEGSLAVDRLILYRSRLGRGPARYEPLVQVLLRGGGS